MKPHFFGFFFRGKNSALSCTKIDWATFWAIFCEHLVTLLASKTFQH
jgi:hypothetical protein